MSANFRLGILIKDFGMIFWGFFGKKGKAILGLGMRPNYCRVQVGAGKAMTLMSQIQWMDGKDCWGAEEGKRLQGSSSNRGKHIKLNKSLRQSTNKLMNSTLVTHLFNSEAKRREMAYIKINETYRYMEKNIIKTQSHKDPNKCCKTSGLSFAKNAEKYVQWSAPLFPRVQTWKCLRKYNI